MSRVVTYANSKFQCFCQIKLDDGERILISIASAPSPSIKVIRLGFFGLWPLQTIWEYNPTLAGGYDAYVRKLAMMFQDPRAKEVKHPLDILRDRLLPCRSITAAQDSLFQAERSLSEPIEKKSATDRDPSHPYLSGVLARFDEGYSEASAFFSKLDPSFKMPSLPEGPARVRAGSAAYGLALGVTAEAMVSKSKFSLDAREVIRESAVNVSYAMFIFTLLVHYLKADNVEIDPQPLASGFASLYSHLNDVQRTEIKDQGTALFQDMIGPGYAKVKDWHLSLSKAVEIWLLSATSDKRTKENDEQMRKVFGYQLEALHKAIAN